MNAGDGPHSHQTLQARRLGIDTHREAVVFMHKECPVCRAEGFNAHARVLLVCGSKSVIATLYQVTSAILDPGEAGLSESAWRMLEAREGEALTAHHPQAVESLSRVRAKIYGTPFAEFDCKAIVGDIVLGRYSDIQLSSFVTACSARGLDRGEITALTRAMIDTGGKIGWGTRPVADKHSVGGLPGNRTTPIIVAIIAAAGLVMPKTSSRAITSPAGTADTMETLAPVDLDVAAMRRVIKKEGGCIVWGGAVDLSPADDVLIRVERALDLDSEGQLVASVLSKKVAAGATHVIFDVPVGSTAKVRDAATAERISALLLDIGSRLGIAGRVLLSDGTQPVGRGIGPALEARDVVAVLRGDPSAPSDLRQRAVALAGGLLELSGATAPGAGETSAEAILEGGSAWAKFQRICEAQGGMRVPPVAAHTRPVLARRQGRIAAIDNRRIAKVAKLAGAPEDKAAGVELHGKIGREVEAGDPLFTVHAESPGELAYALEYVGANEDLVTVAVP